MEGAFFMNKNIKKLTFAAMMCALVCVATMIIKIPVPATNGYIHFGDGFILLSSWIFAPHISFAVSGLGSALADLFSGYTNYALATFLIKGLMAVCAFYSKKLLLKTNRYFSRIVSAFVAEIVMIVGYFVFECFMYSPPAALAAVLPNVTQGIGGIIIGVVVFSALEKPIFKHLLK